MKKKYIAGSVALVAALSLCSYELGRFQESQNQANKKDNRVAYVDAKSSKKNQASKAENLTPDQVSAKEGINAEQIVVKITDQGYVTSHGDHYHYYNGKVPYDAIISEELIMKDPNYVLNDADIVNEVKDGYIIKVNGKYYLYLKDKNHTTNVRTKEEITRQKGIHGASENGISGASNLGGSGHRDKQGRYTTDDGYVFSPTDVIEDTGDGFIVPHGNHTHWIPKSDLSPSELAAAQAYWDSKQGGGNKGHTSPLNNPGANSGWQPPTNNNGSSNQGLPPINNNPIVPNPAPSQPNNPNPAPEQPKPSQPAEKSWQDRLQELYRLPQSQRHVESDGLVFDPAKIVKRTATGVSVPHGNHYHFIYYKDMSPLEEYIARNLPIANQPTYPKTAENPPANQPKTEQPKTETPKTEQPKPEQPKEKPQEEGDHDFHAEHVIGKDDEGYIVQHGNHNHYFYKKDLTAEQIAAAEAQLQKQGEKSTEPAKPTIEDVDRFSRDASDEEKIQYISKTYGVPLEAIRISNGYFVFNNPDQAYDPTHVHPYAVRKEHVRIPLVTGNDELDFLNELYTTALRSGLSPYTIQVENGQFVIPHGDHNHYIKVQSKGVSQALKSRIPALQPAYIVGDFDQKVVLAKVDSLLKESRKLYANDPLKQRRIEMALGAFVETMKKLPSNSTAGYLNGLAQFDKQYIHVDNKVKPTEPTTLDKKYQSLVDKLAIMDTDSYKISKKELLIRLQTAKVAQDSLTMDQVEKLLTALNDFQSRTGITSVEYLKFFYENSDDNRLSKELADKVTNLAMKLYKSQAKIEAINLNELFLDLYQTKNEVLYVTASGKKADASVKTALDSNRLDGHTYKTNIYNFLTGIYGNFAPKPYEEVDSAEIEKVFAQIEEMLAKITDTATKNKLTATLTNLKQTLKGSNTDKNNVLDAAKNLLEQVKQALQTAEENRKPENPELYAKLYELLMGAHRYLEDNSGSDEDFDKVDALLDKLSNPETDKSALWSEVQALVSQIQHPERAGKPNSQIAYTAEEIAAAKAAGRYTTSDGYIFDVKDITSDEGDAYITPHIGHTHWIPKSDLSEAERAAADAYCKEKGLTNKKEKPAPDKKPDAGKESAQAIYERVKAAKIVPVEKMPYSTAYAVEYRNGQLIIPHYAHYHNISLSWFDEGLYHAPDGYSMEQFLATVKYYIENPNDRPKSDNGWGNDSDHIKNGGNQAPDDTNKDDNEKKEEENDYTGENSEDKEEELDDYEKAQKAQAEAMGMSLAEFQAKLVKLALKYNVGADRITFDTNAKNATFTTSDGKTKTVNFLTLEEIN